MSEQFNESEIKARLMAVPPAAVGIALILRGLANPEAGFVVWDAIPPAGLSYYDHHKSFPTAIHTALAFCHTDTRDEWCVLGAVPLIYMRSLPDFEQVEPVVCDRLVFVGRYHTTLLYTEKHDEPAAIISVEFVAGVRERAARGRIQNSSVNMQAYDDLPVRGRRGEVPGG